MHISRWMDEGRASTWPAIGSPTWARALAGPSACALVGVGRRARSLALGWMDGRAGEQGRRAALDAKQCIRRVQRFSVPADSFGTTNFRGSFGDS